MSHFFLFKTELFLVTVLQYLAQKIIIIIIFLSIQQNYRIINIVDVSRQAHSKKKIYIYILRTIFVTRFCWWERVSNFFCLPNNIAVIPASLSKSSAFWLNHKSIFVSIIYKSYKILLVAMHKLKNLIKTMCSRHTHAIILAEVFYALTSLDLIKCVCDTFSTPESQERV